MTRIIALLSSLVALAACSLPTAPKNADTGARIDAARRALESGGGTVGGDGRIATN